LNFLKFPVRIDWNKFLQEDFFMKRGFTLIELLIVVAIIAILAAIAIPNFLQAQMRSKVSRARADMRSVATALETYMVDSNDYPIPHGDAPFRKPESQRYDGYGNARSVAFGTLPPDLTTPIAYITSVPADPFKSGQVANSGVNAGKPYESGNPFDMTFVYHPIRFWAELTKSGTPSGFDQGDIEDYGMWRIFSLGPDGKYNTLGTSDPTGGWKYDPTNGTVSSGMILRTQKDPMGESFSR